MQCCWDVVAIVRRGDHPPSPKVLSRGVCQLPLFDLFPHADAAVEVRRRPAPSKTNDGASNRAWPLIPPSAAMGALRVLRKGRRRDPCVHPAGRLSPHLAGPCAPGGLGRAPAAMALGVVRHPDLPGSRAPRGRRQALRRFRGPAQPRPLRPALVPAPRRHPVGAGPGVSTPGRLSFPRRHRRRRRPAAVALGEGLERPGGLRPDRADPEHGGRPALPQQVRAPGRRAGLRAPDAPATP